MKPSERLKAALAADGPPPWPWPPRPLPAACEACGAANGYSPAVWWGFLVFRGGRLCRFKRRCAACGADRWHKVANKLNKGRRSDDEKKRRRPSCA